jgi:hypothetical protein
MLYAWDMIEWMTTPGEYISSVYYYPQNRERIIGKEIKGQKPNLKKLLPFPIVGSFNATPLG